MKLDAITLKNFRCYEDLTVRLHPQLTVLVANNGGGKTALLDALRIGLWPFVSSFDLANVALDNDILKSLYMFSTINQDDVRVLKVGKKMARQLPTSIAMTGRYAQYDHTWQRSLESEARTAVVVDSEGVGQLVDFAKQQQQEARNLSKQAETLPILAFYGTGRLWGSRESIALRSPLLKKNEFSKIENALPLAGSIVGKEAATVDTAIRLPFLGGSIGVAYGLYKLAKTALHEIREESISHDVVSKHTRTYAYANCLDSDASFEQFEHWYSTEFQKMWEEEREQDKESCSSSDAGLAVRAAQQAIDTVLGATGWHRLEYSISYGRTLILHHPLQGILRVDQLSDGVKNMLAMVADIAYRCVLLNSHLGSQAAQQTPGIVMIDEVDMHLHPSWQQTVLSSLTTAFPNIQFIVTTHSPQVLSTVHRENIRLLGTNEAGQMTVSEPLADSYGEPSNDVLQAIMHVDPQPPVPEKAQLERLTELVDQGLSDDTEAQRLLVALKQSLSPHHPQLEKVERSIRRQRALGR